MNKTILIFMMCTMFSWTGMMNGSTIWIAIYPTGTLAESYFFTIDVDGNMIVEKGERSGDDIFKKPFIQNPTVVDKKLLSEQDLSKIFGLIKRLCLSSNPFEYEIVKDSWDIQVFYKGKTVKQNCYSNISISMNC